MKRLSSTNQNSTPLVNIPDPADNQDAANKAYADTKSSRQDILWFDRLLKAGSSAGFDVSVAGGIQGVAFDGENYYVTTATHLYKYDSFGSLITSRSNAGDGNTHKYLGDLVYKDGKLYVASANFGTGGPYTSYVVEFNSSNLTYVTEHQVSTSDRCDTVTFNNGYFWLPMYGRTIRQYSVNWEFVAEYPMNIGNFTYDPSPNGYGFDGATWIGNNLILNVHEGVYPDCAYILYFNGTHFMRAGQPERPKYCTQGLQYNQYTNQIIVAERAPTGSRVSILNMRTNPPAVSPWLEIGRTTLDSAATSLDVQNIPPFKYLKFIVTALPTGGPVAIVINVNNDSGSKYFRGRDVGDGNTNDVTTSGTSMGLSRSSTSDPFLAEVEMLNVSGFKKIYKYVATQMDGNNAPLYNSGIGSYNDNAVVNRITLSRGGSATGNFGAGSEVIVYGHN